MYRKFVSLAIASALFLSLAAPAFARTPGVTRPEGWSPSQAMFLVCVGSLRERLGIPPGDPTPMGVYSYCLAWLNGEIVSPPSK